MAKSSFLRHALVYGAGEALVSAAGFLLLPLYVRALSPEEYGDLDYLNRLGEIVLLCLLFKGLRTYPADVATAAASADGAPGYPQPQDHWGL